MSRPQVGTLIPVGAVGDAQKEHVLAGKTFSSENAGVGISGTMPNRGAQIITPGTSNKIIPAGYHNGSGYVEGDANLIAANIRSGKTIFGVSGNLLPASATIQTGVSSMTGKQVEKTVTINSIDMSKSFLLFNYTFDCDDEKTEFTGNDVVHMAVQGVIQNSTTLLFKRGYAPSSNGHGISFVYTVITLPNIVVQRGTTMINYEDSFKSVTISSVDTSKSFAIASAYWGKISNPLEYRMLGAMTVRAEIRNSTTLRIYKGGKLYPGQWTYPAWQVVTFL